MAIKGRDKLRAKFMRMPESAKAAARRAVLASANEIAQTQQTLAPVDEGDLKKSIAVTPPGGSTPAYSQPGGKRTAGPYQAIITAGNSDVRYAHLVEFGAAPHTAGGVFEGAQHPGTQAQPFFWPAYRLLRKKAQRRISSGIKRAITKEAKR